MVISHPVCSMTKNPIQVWACTCVLAIATATAMAHPEWDPADWPHPFDIVPGPGVTAVERLSMHHAPLAGTPADTPVFQMRGLEPGGTLVVLGGSHPSEPGAILAALMLIEHARVSSGSLVVIPYANALAIHPEQTLDFETPGGPRVIIYGQRFTLMEHHDNAEPETYTGPSGNLVSGVESRNLNRVWPGLDDGTPTEQIAHAITSLIRANRTTLAFDLHEAANLGGDLPWTLAALPNEESLVRDVIHGLNRDLGFDLMRWRLLDTPAGLSRVEWPASTGARAFLTETVYGNVTPIPMRVGIQLEMIRRVIDEHNRTADASLAIRYDGLPDYSTLVENEPGSWLRPKKPAPATQD